MSEVSPQTFVGRLNSDGGVGNVKCVHPDGSFDIDWVLGGSEKNVARRRITHIAEPARPHCLPHQQQHRRSTARPLDRPHCSSYELYEQQQQPSIHLNAITAPIQWLIPWKEMNDECREEEERTGHISHSNI